MLNLVLYLISSFGDMFFFKEEGITRLQRGELYTEVSFRGIGGMAGKYL